MLFFLLASAVQASFIPQLVMPQGLGEDPIAAVGPFHSNGVFFSFSSNNGVNTTTSGEVEYWADLKKGLFRFSSFVGSSKQTFDDMSFESLGKSKIESSDSKTFTLMGVQTYGISTFTD
jgi:hypothetical protein